MGALSNQEAANGWTDQLRITYEDFSVANAGTLADRATYEIQYTIPAGSHVRNVAIRVDTAFNDSGGGDQLDIDVGDDADPDGYLNDLAIHTDDSPITYACNNGALVDGTANGKVYTAADTIDMLFTPDAATGQAYSLNELTAGDITLLFDIAQI